MKVPCGVIQDLLPLYHDGICSEESRVILEEHLAECPSCREYYASLCESDRILPTPQDTELELKKAASLRAVKRRIRKKQVLIVALVFAILAVLSFFVIGLLKNAEQVIAYADNISVSLVDNNLVGRLQGNQANYLKIKQVTISQDGKTDTCLFFCLSGTKWDDLITSDTVFSEYMLCAADKGAKQVDRVLYYTGDYTGIESLNREDLQKVLDASVLLWSK